MPTRRRFIKSAALLAGTATAQPTSNPWPSQPPPGCPFPRSESLRGIAFTGRHAEYTQADTWYPSWASDGNLYSPWTDGKVNGISSTSKVRQLVTPRSSAIHPSTWPLQTLVCIAAIPRPTAADIRAAVSFTTASGTTARTVCTRRRDWA
jgi:hypothetical protein